jgi:hypothetical protein
MKLHTQILIGLLAGAALGITSRAAGAGWLQNALVAIEPAGTIFVQLIMMVLVPLVVSSMFVAMASLGDTHRLTRIGGRTLAYFLISTMIGAIIGLSVALLVRPGAGLDPAIRDALVAQSQGNAGKAAAAANASPGILQLLISMIPQNPFGAAAGMKLLPPVIAVVIFGAAANQISESRRQVPGRFFRGMSDLCMVVLRWGMKLAPYYQEPRIRGPVVGADNSVSDAPRAARHSPFSQDSARRQGSPSSDPRGAPGPSILCPSHTFPSRRSLPYRGFWNGAVHEIHGVHAESGGISPGRYGL